MILNPSLIYLAIFLEYNSKVCGCICTIIFVRNILNVDYYGVMAFWESEDILPVLPFWPTFNGLFEASDLLLWLELGLGWG